MMKLQLFIILIAAAVTLPAQDFKENASRSLFSDYKAIRLGDAITVIVMEESEASNSANLSSGRTSGLSFGASGTMDDEAMIPTANGDFSLDNQFEGGGSITSGGMMKTMISAQIDSVLPNGNLSIVGYRVISINGEDQEISIKGIVRPSDVQADNTVYSYNISEAEIVLEGSGMIDRNTVPGIFTRIIHWLF